ncbi:uncharacterized protein LOC107364146 [Tetranychus urticae]|uniref:uncharacterized protein LOC107364146 n=1 Tax=Tetranychus urticae TaxID=32264 RepID=UPI00077BF909|nr:uncharacterized protein LOC107364146 [Tetranychus urticae]
MDSGQFISLIQSSLDSPTLDADYASQCDTLAVQPFPQSPCSNQSLALLKAFCSDEDTVKSYLLQDGEELDNQNNEGQQFFDLSAGSINSFTENWFSFNGQNKSSNRTIENPSTNSLSIESQWQSTIRDTYDALKTNFISLVESGYKMSLSLNTDNSEVEEPWNPDVSQKILSVSFSSLSLRSEYLSDDAVLNGFESLLMDEACAAFEGQKHLNLFANLNDTRRAIASPDCLISICSKIKGFRRIETNDKITLLSSNYIHLNVMEGIFHYDAAIDGWDFPEFKYDRRDTFIFNQCLHDGVVHVIETFPDRLRNDMNAVILMYLIIIFNPDSSELKYPESIRHEQFSYIHLLRRYLRTICESDCEASDNHYRLMVEIDRIKFLSEQCKKEFALLVNEPLKETITRAVAGRCRF